MKFLPLLLLRVFRFLRPASLRADEYEARTFSGADSAQLGYRLLTPKNFDAKRHGEEVSAGAGAHGAASGDRQCGTAQIWRAALLKPEVRDQYPCFVVVPAVSAGPDVVGGERVDGPNAYEEQPTAPMKLLLAALDGLLQEFPAIDQDRLYVTGLSMGGYGTWI